MGLLAGECVRVCVCVCECVCVCVCVAERKGGGMTPLVVGRAVWRLDVQLVCVCSVQVGAQKAMRLRRGTVQQCVGAMRGGWGSVQCCTGPGVLAAPLCGAVYTSRVCGCSGSGRREGKREYRCVCVCRITGPIDLGSVGRCCAVAGCVGNVGDGVGGGGEGCCGETKFNRCAPPAAVWCLASQRA